MQESQIGLCNAKERKKNIKENRKVKIRFFPGAKIKDMFHYAIPLLEKNLIMSFYMLTQMMHQTKLVQIFRIKYWN